MVGRYMIVVALVLVVVACDNPNDVEVERWEQLGEVGAVKVTSVVDRAINFAITTIGNGCLTDRGRTEVSAEGMTIDILPFDTMSAFGSYCLDIRRGFTREVSVVVPSPGSYTATIRGRGISGDTTATIREITVE